ncbi:ribonucleotide reductase [Sparassis latifolia]
MSSHTLPDTTRAIAQCQSRHGEPILQTSRRFVLFPIQYGDVWKAYKTALASFWTAEEIDLMTDVIHWTEKLTPSERHFVSVVLAFFAASDGIVNENLVQQFCSEVQIAEARCFYGFQIAIENVHSEVYSMLIATLIEDHSEQTRLFNGIDTIPSIRQKAEWCIHWIEDITIPFPTRLVAFAIVEGVFFSSSFAAIYWLRSKVFMPGLCHSNELIAPDEGLHTDFACLLYHHILNKTESSRIYQMMDEAVKLEQAFFADAIPDNLIGINALGMCDYIEHVADRLLKALGYSTRYHKRNPFPFMEMISLDGRTNFFERKVSDYRISDVGRFLAEDPHVNHPTTLFSTTESF